MNSGTKRSLNRICFYLFFIAVCLAGLLPGTGTISSSRSLTLDPKDKLNRKDIREQEAALFYEKRDLGQLQGQSSFEARYDSNTPLWLREVKQESLQSARLKDWAKRAS